MAGWHSGVEIVSRDRCGLYAEGVRQGALQANQVADRFHLLQNLRQTIEQQLSRAPRPTRQPSPTNPEAKPVTSLDGWVMDGSERWWNTGAWSRPAAGPSIRTCSTE
jgi:hypothetical protein